MTVFPLPPGRASTLFPAAFLFFFIAFPRCGLDFFNCGDTVLKQSRTQESNRTDPPFEKARPDLHFEGEIT
ncbi:MAG: hypothetical protein IJT68_10335 [Lentisphaeria bacterium]|nr:hypothetical protein [Lentisphaeria bacterium]